MIQSRPFRVIAGLGLWLLLLMTSASWAQVIAGSPEDKAYQAISRETDDKKRLELLDAFVKTFPNTPDMAQIYEYYAISYRNLGDADKEIEYSEKSLALRKDAQLMVMMGRVLAIQGKDLPKALRTIREAIDLATKSRDNPPLGVQLKDWQPAQDGVVTTGEQLLAYALDRYKQVFAARLSAETDPSKIISLMDEFSTMISDPETKPALYDQYMRAYFRLGNRAKVVEYAGKLLSLSPNDVEVLAFTTNAYLETPQDLDNAMAQAQKAVTIADSLDTQIKPANLTDDLWAKQKTAWKTLAYSTRGLVELQNDTTLDLAVADLEKARGIAPEDGLVQYRLGIAYWKSKRIDDAISALAKSASVPSGIQTQANQLLETYYKAAHNGSTDGLKELIEKSKGTSEKPNGD